LARIFGAGWPPEMKKVYVNFLSRYSIRGRDKSYSRISPLYIFEIKDESSDKRFMTVLALHPNSEERISKSEIILPVAILKTFEIKSSSIQTFFYLSGVAWR